MAFKVVNKQAGIIGDGSLFYQVTSNGRLVKLNTSNIQGSTYIGYNGSWHPAPISSTPPHVVRQGSNMVVYIGGRPVWSGPTYYCSSDGTCVENQYNSTTHTLTTIITSPNGRQYRTTHKFAPPHGAVVAQKKIKTIQVLLKWAPEYADYVNKVKAALKNPYNYSVDTWNRVAGNLQKIEKTARQRQKTMKSPVFSSEVLKKQKNSQMFKRAGSVSLMYSLPTGGYVVKKGPGIGVVKSPTQIRSFGFNINNATLTKKVGKLFGKK